MIHVVIKNENKWPGLDRVEHRDSSNIFQKQERQYKDDEPDMIFNMYTWYGTARGATSLVSFALNYDPKSLHARIMSQDCWIDHFTFLS